MRITMINANECLQPFPVFPYGAAIVSQALIEDGHEVDFIDLTFEKPVWAFIRRRLLKFKPEVIGISLRNIDNNYIQSPTVYFELLLPLIQAIRTECDVPIILGGAAVSVMPNELQHASTATWAISGPGEIIFPTMLKVMSADGKLPNDNPVFRVEGKIVYPRSMETATNGYAVAPDFRSLFSLRKYMNMAVPAPVQTKKGCPFQCFYCTYSAAEGRSYQLYSPESVVQAVAAHVSNGLRDIEFVDNVFNSPYDHALAICKELKNAGTGARIQSLELSPAFIDHNLLSAMTEAGFTGIGITAESVSNTVLEGLGKPYSAQHIYKSAEITKDYEIPCCWIFMIGGPGETPDTLKTTLDFAANNVGERDVAFFNVGIRIYPGTHLEKIARAQGILAGSAFEMLQPKFYVSPALTYELILEELQSAARTNLHFITGDALPNPLMRKVISVSTKLGLRQPLWKYTKPIRSILQTLRMYP